MDVVEREFPAEPEETVPPRNAASPQRLLRRPSAPRRGLRGPLRPDEERRADRLQRHALIHRAGSRVRADSHHTTAAAGYQGDLLAGWQAAALTGRITVGPRAGWQVTRIGGQPVAMAPRGKGLCADADGVNLHAGVHVPAGQPQRLERLLRYLLRPPLVRDRLSLLPDGRVLLRLKRPYADGTEALVLSPHDLIARLCALISPPRVHLIHYSGVFAPHAALRRKVVPQMDALADKDQRAASQAVAPTELAPTKLPHLRRLSWAELMRRTWGLDVLACPCGGRLRLLGFVMAPTALASITRSLERPAAASRAQLPLALGP